MKRNTNQHSEESSVKPENINSEDIVQEDLKSEDKLTEEVSNDNGSENPNQELEKLQQKYDELNDSYLRLNAEFDNFRKRTIKEKAEIIKSGGERVLINIITLVDDFERALSALHASDDRDAMLEGMDLIYSKFISFLKQNGVEEIEALGLPFNSDTFEAVTTIPAQDESQKGVVVDCIQKGYKLNDKIIRFPKVVVGE
ncbi:MAG TPA: nucleotide exchange factor GrpE [Bacteroidales bacterium]|nr:nucleotide exchange factor GrpE [Bacteroidales bacterium]